MNPEAWVLVALIAFLSLWAIWDARRINKRRDSALGLSERRDGRSLRIHSRVGLASQERRPRSESPKWTWVTQRQLNRRVTDEQRAQLELRTQRTVTRLPK